MAQEQGPILDAQARAQLDEEQEMHQRRLTEIETQDPSIWADLLPEESDRHLKSLTRIYSELASRALDVKRTVREQREKL